jgi:hypothetical protein
MLDGPLPSALDGVVMVFAAQPEAPSGSMQDVFVPTNEFRPRSRVTLNGLSHQRPDVGCIRSE